MSPSVNLSSSTSLSGLRYINTSNWCFKMMLIGNLVAVTFTRPFVLASSRRSNNTGRCGRRHCATWVANTSNFRRFCYHDSRKISHGCSYAAFTSILLEGSNYDRQQQRPSTFQLLDERSNHSHCTIQRRSLHCLSSLSSSSSSLFFSTSSESVTASTTPDQLSSSSLPPPPPLVLDPKAPLRPLLAEKCRENHLSHYTLPPTILGVDDYRPILLKNQRIVAFGDVHGDIMALRSFLLTAKILDPNSTNDEPKWSGGTTICVQTGDVLDRGDDELACYRLLATLSRQAKEAGGAILLLYGNHESLNAAGLFQYANPGGNLEFETTIGSRIDYNFGSNRWRLQFAGNEPSRWAAFEPGGLLAENMMQNMLVACVLGRTVFVHAGLTASHLTKKDTAKTATTRRRIGENIDMALEVEEQEDGFDREYEGISRLNEQAREWILKAHHGENNNWGEFNSVQEVIAAAQNRAKVASKTMPDCLGGGIGASSPVWMRDYSQPNDREPKNPKAKIMIEEALKESGPDVQRMVMGHTPQSKINSALDGKAWRIDVGASKGVMGGTPEVLEIIHRGGENDEDIVNILTQDGKQISGNERSVTDAIILDLFDMKR